MQTTLGFWALGPMITSVVPVMARWYLIDSGGGRLEVPARCEAPAASGPPQASRACGVPGA